MGINVSTTKKSLGDEQMNKQIKSIKFVISKNVKICGEHEDTNEYV